MKHTRLVAVGTLLLLGISISATAQSLGDVARAARKNKTGEASSAGHHYDNDNLPSDQSISVVGPPASEVAKSEAAANPAAADPAAAAERQKAADEFKKQLDQQKQKIDSLTHDFDLEQREYRLHSAGSYATDPNRMRDRSQWALQDAKFKSDLEEKQKALDAARQQLETMQDQAHKSGVAETQPSGGTNPATDDKK